MEAIGTLSGDTQSNIYFSIWENYHRPLFYVKIPIGFEFVTNDTIITFSTSF
jgi:hypothetical protein